MALIVEDGSGLANADSYLSVADADTYHTAHGNPAAWSGASTAAKESALQLATQYLDAVYGTRWDGQRINSTMSLDWPRFSVVDPDGFLLPSNAVPRQVKDACAYLALQNVNGDTLVPDTAAGGNVSSESVSVGPISTSTTYSGDKSGVKTYRLVDLLIAEIALGGGVISRA